MNKYKICIYAICKNEEKYIDTWYNSVKEADKIFILDTGSTDNTFNLLKDKEKVTIKKEIISPWRFDIARNKSLDMVDKDTDICICIDLDEILLPGWRKILEQNWKEDTTRVYYTYNWKLDNNNKPLVTFYTDKIHKRNGYKWTHPVHEVLTPGIIEHKIIIKDIILNHYPDLNKSRSNYLPLLEMSVKESPNDDRNMHYLGREYMYHQKYNEAIDILIKHLNLKTATWKDERAASMRFIGRCYNYLERYDEAILWYKKAIKEAPYLRDPYVELALLYHKLNKNNKVIYYTNKALSIKNKDMTYINEIFSWDNTIYDIRSIAFYNIGKYKASLKNINIAISMDKTNKRLINNKKIIERNI